MAPNDDKIDASLIEEIKKHINAWCPRGLDMFGNPESRETNVAFGFKGQVNRDALSAYMRESTELVHRLNRVIEVEINGPRAGERSPNGYLYLPAPTARLTYPEPR